MTVKNELMLGDDKNHGDYQAQILLQASGSSIQAPTQNAQPQLDKVVI